MARVAGRQEVAVQRMHRAVRPDRPPGRHQGLRGDLAAERAHRRPGVAAAAERVLVEGLDPQQIGERSDRVDRPSVLFGQLCHGPIVADRGAPPV